MFMMCSSQFARCAHLKRTVPVDQSWGQCAERHGCRTAECPLQHRFAGFGGEREQRWVAPTGVGFPIG